MKTFLTLWTSQAVSIIGSALVQFALAWYLTKETGSATVLATAMLVAWLPQIVLGPLIGPYIDRWNRKRIMIIADLSMAVVTFGLVALFFSGAVQIWHIYVAMAARSIGATFHFPAMAASIPLLVPEKHLSRVGGLNMTLQGIVMVAAPPAGALLLEALPMYGVLAVDIVTAVIAVGCLLFISIPQPERTTLIAKASALNDMAASYRYVWHNARGLLMLIGLFAIGNFFVMPALRLLPILVTEHLGGDVLKLGWLNSGFGVGMVGGGIVMSAWGGFRRRIVTVLIGEAVLGASIFALGFVSMDLFFLGLAAAFFQGIGIAFGNAPIMAIFQSLVPKDMQGRVFGVLGSISQAVVPLGLAVAGPTADAIGVRSVYFIAGAAWVAILVLATFSRTLMNVESSVKPQESEQRAEMVTG
ncbi:MAG: hypothetical protein A2147_02180 [Chloroflexi bacterium RBG_16_57_8]|nr:MAG: hypothetical protein A2147_02180 [Chloroflexi bacterium RBG_16_57_8]